MLVAVELDDASVLQLSSKIDSSLIIHTPQYLTDIPQTSLDEADESPETRLVDNVEQLLANFSPFLSPLSRLYS